MTKREKLQEAFSTLFEGFEAEEFLSLVYNEPETFCCICKYSDECDRAFYETDADGNFVHDKDGDLIVRDDAETCENILARHLDDEVD